MKKNGNWLIALDLTPADMSIIEYVKYLADTLDPNRLTFVHVSRTARRPRLLDSEALDYDHPVNEELRLLLKASLRGHFDLSSENIRSIVSTGDAHKEIKRLAALLDIDLIFLGKKKRSRGTGMVSEKLISDFESDIFLVPEGFEPKLDHVLLSTDFSAHATAALESVMQLKDYQPHLQMTAFNSFNVPMGYSKTGKQYEEVEAIMRRHSAMDMTSWLDRHQVEARTVLSHDQRMTPMQQLLHYIHEHPVDLLVLGTKNHTELSRLILGSNAWRIILGNQETPLLIVKKDNEPVGLKQIVAYL